ncbi:MAG: hypothetical protein Q4D73_01310 [Actinomycetaceae bacterium]|nr:hypothetical protein [Actinomycetaceae bacterium]
MAASLIKMKLRMAWNGMRREKWKLVLFIILGLYFLGIYGVTLTGIAFGAASGELVNYAHVVNFAGILGVSVVFLAWLIGPVVGYGFDDTLDPRRFSTLMPPNKKLGRALIVATMFGLGALLTTALILLLFIALVGAHNFVAAAVLLAITPVALYTFSLWGRALSTTLGHALMANSKRKDRTVFITTAIFLAIMAPLGLWINVLAANATVAGVGKFANILLWLPLSAPFGIAFALSEGAWLQFAVQIVYAVVLLVAGQWLWNRTLAPSMVGVAAPVSPQAQEAIAQGRHLVDPNLVKAEVTSAFDLGKELPLLGGFLKLGMSSPLAAMSARTLQMRMKDPRISTSVLGLLIFPMMAVFMPKLQGGEFASSSVGFSFGFFMYFVPFILAMTIATLPSYDSTSFWGYISVGLSGKADRLGRLFGSLPVVFFILPLSAALPAIFNTGTSFVSMLVTLFTVFAMALAVIQLVTTFWLPGVQPPGSSPLSTKGAGNQMIAFLLMMVGPIVVFVLYLPVLLAFWFLATPGSVLEVVILLAGLLWGLAILAGSLLLSIKFFPKQAPHLLEQIKKWPGH